MTDQPALEIRSLSYSDLPAVATIERRAFPTPWSIAMFVLELSKPTGVCLAAVRDGALVGYTICSRYDTDPGSVGTKIPSQYCSRGLGMPAFANSLRSS